MITRREAICGAAVAAVSRLTSSDGLLIRQARSASSFIDSIGINVHLSYPSYFERLSEVVAPRLIELGVRHIRDTIALTDRAVSLTHSLFESAGIRTTLLSSPITNTPDAAPALILQRFGRRTVAAIEGINEPDGWFRSQPAALENWATVTLHHQRALYRAIKRRADLLDLPVIGPAIIDVSNVDVLQAVAPFANVANIHPYPGGRHPETSGWGELMRGFNYGSLDWSVANAMPRVQPTSPIIATETGYHNAADSEGARQGVPYWVSAIYLPRLFLHYFNKGIVRSFIYELLDERNDSKDPEACFGLLRSDGSAKPAFVALCNLITLLSDTGNKSLQTGFLGISFGEAPVESVLLQKSDGTFYLAIWLARRIWDPATSRPDENPDRPLTISFSQDVRDLAMARPNQGTNWTTIPHLSRQVEIVAIVQVTLIRLSIATTLRLP